MALLSPHHTVDQPARKALFTVFSICYTTPVVPAP
jgi:hypothetical protein